VASLPLGVEGILDARLPRAMDPTIYSQYGNVPLILFLVVATLVLGKRRLRA